MISPLSFAMLSGAGLMHASKDDRIRVHTTFDLPILEGGKVKIDLDTAGKNHDIYISEDVPTFGMILDNTGAGIIPCSVNKIEGSEPNCNVYTITKEKPLELTFSNAENYVGQTLRVDTYAEKVDGAVEMTIDAKNFAGSYYVEASTLWRDRENGVDYPAEMVFPNVKIQSNFTFTMAASGDPSTFSFTLDSMPAYTVFDKTKKVFAAIQVIADEELDAIEDDVESCPPLAVEFTSIVAGISEFGDDKQFDGDPKNIQFASLGSGLKASIDRANVDFTGNLRKVDNWTAFSDKPADLTGYYMPFTVEAPAGAKIVRTTLSGEEKTITLASGKENLIWAIDPKAPVITLELQNGDESQEYSWDFSRIRFN